MKLTCTCKFEDQNVFSLFFCEEDKSFMETLVSIINKFSLREGGNFLCFMCYLWDLGFASMFCVLSNVMLGMKTKAMGWSVKTK
jgi:hypothetical protein